MAVNGLLVRKIVKQEVDVPGLGSAIKAAQVASGLSIEAVIRAAGISRTYWNNLVKERSDGISADLLSRLEETLKVDFGVSFDD